MVETDATSRSRARRLLVLLGCILAVTGLGVSLLVLVNRPTVVELKVSVRQIDLDIESPSESMVDPDSAYALRRVSLLDPGLVLTSLEAKDFECIETTLETVGRVVLRPSSGGSVTLDTMGSGDSGADVEGQGAADEAETFQAELIIQDPLRLSIEAPGRNSLLMKLQPSGKSASSPANGSQPSSRSSRCSEPAEGDWSGQISTGVEMTAGLRNVRVASLGGRFRSDISGTRSYRVPADADSITILGGRRASRLNLALPLDRNPATWMRVLDPATGEVVATRRLPFALSEARVIPWQDRVVLLDMNPGEPWPVLRPNLRVRRIEFSRRVELEPTSYVTGGKVRFPAGEKEAIEIEPDSFLALSLKPDEPLTLRSIAFSRGGLDLVLWGEPTSLRLGPTPELRVECLPSYLEWLLAHRLAQLIYVVLAWIAGSTLALLKILGLLDK
jgi:hypothetical protein